MAEPSIINKGFHIGGFVLYVTFIEARCTNGLGWILFQNRIGRFASRLLERLSSLTFDGESAWAYDQGYSDSQFRDGGFLQL